MSSVSPSLQSGYARNASESRSPRLWRGLLGWWDPGVGNQGSRLLDFSGRGHHAPWVNLTGASVVSGRKGRALEYVAANETHCLIGEPESLKPTVQITLAAWIFLTIGQPSSWGRIVSKTNGGTGDNWGLIIAAEFLAERVSFRVNNTQHNTADPVSLNVWHHIAATYDGVRARVFVDCRMLVDNAQTGAITTTGAVAIGALATALSTRSFNGRIGAVGVWNRALLESELLYLAGSGSPLDRKRTVVGFVASEPSGGITGDLSETLDDVEISGEGSVQVTGELEDALDDVEISGEGSVQITGELEADLDDVEISASGSGTVQITGELEADLDDVEISGEGSVQVTGELEDSLEDSELSASGSVSVLGELESFLENLSLSASGSVGISGSLVLTLDDSDLSGSGLSGDFLTGNLSLELGSVTLSARGRLIQPVGPTIPICEPSCKPKISKHSSIPVFSSPKPKSRFTFKLMGTKASARIPCPAGDVIQDGADAGGGLPGGLLRDKAISGVSRKAPPPPPQIFENEEVIYTAECPDGYDGDPVTVVIPAGTYSSPIPGRATVRAMRDAIRQASEQLECTFEQFEVFPALFRFECANFETVENFVTTESEEGEFPYDGNSLTFEEAYLIARASLEAEGLAELNCDPETCSALSPGTPVEASLPFETQCVGGTWFSDPLPELDDRWTVNENPEGWPE